MVSTEGLMNILCSKILQRVFWQQEQLQPVFIALEYLLFLQVDNCSYFIH